MKTFKTFLIIFIVALSLDAASSPIEKLRS